MDLGVTGFESQLFNFLPVWSWVSYLISLCFSVLICKMEVIEVPTLLGFVKIQ